MIIAIAFILQMNIFWKKGNLTSLAPRNCTLNTMSPAPSAVLNVVLIGATVVRNKEVVVNATWTAPLVPNGSP